MLARFAEYRDPAFQAAIEKSPPCREATGQTPAQYRRSVGMIAA
jgi:hypothetical protein